MNSSVHAGTTSRVEQHGMTADATIDYDGLQQEALRGLVRTVLVQVAKSGLPGDHHLYISFDVRAPGVVLSKRLREKYPHEMTIVLQHRFWDLAVSDERFEVKLTFDGIPERLVVPFAAIKVFLDPSVRYVLHFEEPGSASVEPAGNASDEGDETRPNGPRTLGQKKPRAPRPRTRAEREAGTAPGHNGLSAVPTTAPAALGLPPATALPSLPKKTVGPTLASTGPAPPDRLPSTSAAAPAADVPASTEPAKPAPGAQVVSLDAFRKK
jgi:uncharacterized protein